MAFCDPLSVDPARDFIAVDDVFATHVSEIYNVFHQPTQEWYYLPNQTANEVLLFNGFDSACNLERAVPHCSFSLGAEAVGQRESIEVRAIVFF